MASLDFSSTAESKKDSSSESEDSIRIPTSTQRQDRGRHGPVRMEFPWLTGIDPQVWIDHAQQYFDAQGVEKSEKVQIASFYLEGEANQWWR